MDWIKAIRSIENVLFYLDYPLKNFTTYRVGGNAAGFVFVRNSEELRHVLTIVREFSVPYFIVGMGSNLLISDRGYSGLVIKLTGDFSKITVEGERLIAGAGASLIKASYEALKNGLSGLEFACGIPGSVGGAVFMNAGAYGEDIGGVVENIYVSCEDGSQEVLNQKDVTWEYRKGLQNSRIIFTTIFKLNPKTIDIIQKKMDNNNTKRNMSHPKGFSAGSVFKNPIDMKAFELIIDAGLRGFSIGGAVVSEHHANFILNKGNATAQDIFSLIETIRIRVYERKGVLLIPEIRMIGDFDSREKGWNGVVV